MFSLFPRPLDRHFIGGGSVFCPARERDVECDECAGCRWMLEMDTAAKLPFVRCHPPARPLIPRD